MKIILLQDVQNVGKKYEVKNISDGFARNFLFPRKLAEIATNETIKSFDIKRKQTEDERKIHSDLLEKNLESINGLKISIKEKTNEKGHLFAAIHPKEIVEIIKKQSHIDISEDMIKLDKPIKEIGEHEIKVKNKKFLLVVSSQ